ncbi:MAG TPA: hypothetical protein PLR07_12010, partial [Promineifilum sp.]|nr:hypothetical protein [Promineifilum sp.]
MTSPVTLLRHCNNYKPDGKVFAKKGQVGVSCPFSPMGWLEDYLVAAAASPPASPSGLPTG